MLRLLAGLGTGFDCASHAEITQVLEIGVSPTRIVFANPCKPTSFVRGAARAGVDMMTFDNADELYKVARAHPRAKLIVRILTDDSRSLCRLGLKFGAPLAAVPGLLATARGLGLDVIGVSFHVGSGCFDPDAFGDAVGRARAAFEMGRTAGYRFTLLDVGGGFEDGEFERMAGVLRRAIDVHFPDREKEGVRVIAEPGRFFVSRAFTLAANIIARRVTEGGGEADSGETPSVMCECPVGDARLWLTVFRLYQRRSVRVVQLHPVRPPDGAALCGDAGRFVRVGDGAGAGETDVEQRVGADVRLD